MNDWLNDLGAEKFTDKDFDIMVRLVTVLIDAASDDFVKDEFLEKLENAEANVIGLHSRIKELLKKGSADGL